MTLEKSIQKPAYILGISSYYHDSAAVILKDGEIMAAAQEERFSRIKGDSQFPHHALSYCLAACSITEKDLDYIAFYEHPIVKFDRILISYLATAPFSLKSYLSALPAWLTDKLWLQIKIAREMGIKKKILFCDHHLSHASSAFYPSPFQNAAIITIDGVGEHSTTTIGLGKSSEIELMEEMRFPNSVGLLYSAFTYFTGFKINSGEYKLMGLAPYGQPKYAELIKEKIAHIQPNGAVVLNQKYFNYTKGLTMTNQRFNRLFGGLPRKPETQITQREMDIAASIQSVVNEIVLKIANYAHKKSKQDNVVLAGGVALNVVANGLLSKQSPFKKIWIQPAAGDAGGALGAAYWVWHKVLGNSRRQVKPDAMKGALLGPSISERSTDDDKLLKTLGGQWEYMEEKDLAHKIACEIRDGKVIAVARGNMEFGPRALGARSIFGDARRPEMQKHINLKVKFRESFRPFAPMVLVEDVNDYFEAKQDSPYMLFTYDVVQKIRKSVNNENLTGINLLQLPRSEIPAVTHVDFSARIQTVDQIWNPFIWQMLNHFKEMTGCSVIVNTSFNVRGEPIVNSVEDAYRCFMATEIDSLVIGNRFFRKEKQLKRPLTQEARLEWLRRFDLD